MKRHTLAATSVLAMLFLLTLGVSSASADTITYNLTTGNSPPGLSCCSGPYATVTVDLTSSTTATITFGSLTNGGYTYLIGSQNAAAVNVNASTFTVTGITGSNSFTGFTPGPFSSGGASHMDGFGNFNASIIASDGFKSSATQISFTLTDTSGTWASASKVLNNGIAAIHGFACKSPCTVTEGAFKTGFAGNAAPVPDGGVTLMLLGGVLVGVESLRRKFRV